MSSENKKITGATIAIDFITIGLSVFWIVVTIYHLKRDEVFQSITFSGVSVMAEF